MSSLCSNGGEGFAQDHLDYVPDKTTAEHIAQAVLIPQYGEERSSSRTNTNRPIISAYCAYKMQ
jgi:hypothetical protein